MPNDPANADPPALEEELVAYLDGELDEQASRRIEKLLGADPNVRQRLQRLEQTWEALDRLEQAEVAEAFTHKTLKIVATAAEADIEHQRAEIPRRRLRRWLIAATGLVTAGVAGFLIVVLARPDPNRQLLQDLPVLENLDQYRQIDGVEFLQMLHRENLFAEETGDEL